MYQIDRVTSPIDLAKQQKSPIIVVLGQLGHSVQCKLYSRDNHNRFTGGGEVYEPGADPRRRRSNPQCRCRINPPPRNTKKNTEIPRDYKHIALAEERADRSEGTAPNPRGGPWTYNEGLHRAQICTGTSPNTRRSGEQSPRQKICCANDEPVRVQRNRAYTKIERNRVCRICTGADRGRSDRSRDRTES